MKVYDKNLLQSLSSYKIILLFHIILKIIFIYYVLNRINNETYFFFI